MRGEMGRGDDFGRKERKPPGAATVMGELHGNQRLLTDPDRRKVHLSNVLCPRL
jgi:hypothetical protein